MSIIDSCLTKERLFADNPGRYLVSSGIAGMYIAFGAFASMMCGSLCCGIVGPASKLAMAFAFASALSFIVVAGGELFTGNNLVLGLGSMTGNLKWSRCICMWSVCWVGNLIGALATVAIFVLSGAANTPGFMEFVTSVGHAKCSLGIGEMFFRGILCNALVCLAVWCGSRLREEISRLVMVFWCIFVFMVCGFEHSIANMAIIGIPLLSGAEIQFGWTDFAVNLAVVTGGNIVGGLGLIGVPYFLVCKK